MGGRSGGVGGGGATFSGIGAIERQAGVRGATVENMRSVRLQNDGTVVITGSGGSQIGLSRGNQRSFQTAERNLTSPQSAMGAADIIRGSFIRLTPGNRAAINRRIARRSRRETGRAGQ